MTAVLIIGVVLNLIALPLALYRVLFLYRLTMSGKPAPDRVENVTKRLGTAIKTEVLEVFGQKKLLKWTVPGLAHFFVFWAFLILITVYIEAYAALFSRNPEWHWFIFGNWPVLGFLQDFIAVMCFLGIVAFWWIRIKNAPEKLGRKSRFDGSHTTGAYFVLFMIFNVLWTLFLFRGAVEARAMHRHEDGGYGGAAFVSHALGTILPDSTWLIGIGLLLHIGIMLVFLIDVLHSKHLHIFVAPLNVLFGRRPVALGAVKPLMSEGKPITLDDIDDLDEDATLGIGNISDFSWKGQLDFASCTECGRCQSQCPAWNTEKPLSPKMLIMNLRDHAQKSAPYLLEKDEAKREALPEAVLTEVNRPLVGETEGPAWEPTGGAIIDNDVLWSCTSCGACVNQCPVDIEHVDHIIDMRRYQVLVESNFPSELNGLFRGLENNGNPWNLSPNSRMDWAKGLDFEVPVVGEAVEDMENVEWLFWVGCAGAYEDRAKKTARAVAELLHTADVDFAVLGKGETCTGDPARRAGNEFVYQGLAQQNIETFKEMKVKKVVATCPHCLNTLKNEYRQLGIELEVVHHTQLLNKLVREKKLTPVAVPGGQKRPLTYHDPCYLGRHNQVYSPPRELLTVIPEAELNEMPRNSERSFCCGAGGARMWMEETIGERVNVNRTKEAVATGADQIAVACPFCRVMLEDGLTAEQSDGNAREEVEVLDVAQLLLASVKGEAPQAKASSAKGSATAARPSGGDATQTASTVTKTQDAGPAAAAAPAQESGSGTGGSLFDVAGDQPPTSAPQQTSAPGGGGSLFDTPADQGAKAEEPAKPESTGTGGGSLFDVPADKPAESSAAPAAPEKPTEKPAGKPAESSSGDLGGGSLFDIPAQEPTAGTTPPDAAAPPAPKPSEPGPAESVPDDAGTSEATGTPSAESSPVKQSAEPAGQPTSDIGSGSLFDIPAQEQPAAPAKPAADAPAAPAEQAEAPTEQTEQTEQSSDAPEEAAPAQPEAEQPSPEQKPATGSGESHTPRTDADINQSGSLFDL